MEAGLRCFVEGVVASFVWVGCIVGVDSGREEGHFGRKVRCRWARFHGRAVMKGVILVALRELAERSLGKGVWQSAVESAGLSAEPLLLATSDVEDETALALFKGVAEAAGISFKELARRFGTFWMGDFAPRVYGAYSARLRSVRDILEQIDRIHREVTQRLARAAPPRFEVTWRDERTALVRYRSHRGLVELAMGLVEGAAEVFREEIQVRRAGPESFLVFLSSGKEAR